jgi:hypothetical protein
MAMKKPVDERSLVFIDLYGHIALAEAVSRPEESFTRGSTQNQISVAVYASHHTRFLFPVSNAVLNNAEWIDPEVMEVKRSGNGYRIQERLR